MLNLLKETTDCMTELGLTPSEIVFIGSSDMKYGCTWEEFVKISDFQYFNGFGQQEVASDLIILFRCGSRMYRGEYDGSEGWVSVRNLPIPTNPLPITRLKCDEDEDGWLTVEELNSIEK